MLTEFPGLLLWGIPGLLVWLLGQAFVFRAALARHERSPRGVRLTLVGVGLFTLGLTVGGALAALARGLWPVAVVVVTGPGSVSAVFFQWASKVGASSGRSQVNNATSTTSSQNRTDRVEAEGCTIDTETSAGG
jgi:hypothetical protein